MKGFGANTSYARPITVSIKIFLNQVFPQVKFVILALQNSHKSLAKTTVFNNPLAVYLKVRSVKEITETYLAPVLKFCLGFVPHEHVTLVGHTVMDTKVV